MRYLIFGMVLFIGMSSQATETLTQEYKAGGIYLTASPERCYIPTLKADGRLLPIAHFPDLFKAYGNKYGGDPKASFAIPDLRNYLSNEWGKPFSTCIYYKTPPRDPDECELAELLILPEGATPPAPGFQKAEGQKIAIRSNPALFALVGHAYTPNADPLYFEVPNLARSVPSDKVGYICTRGYFPTHP